MIGGSKVSPKPASGCSGSERVSLTTTNDGDLDLFVANGHVLDDISRYRNNISYPQPNQLLENRGGRFYDVSKDAGPALRSSRVSRGTAFGDFDNDGDVDLVVTNIDDSPGAVW